LFSHDRTHEASPHLTFVASDILARLPVVLAGGFNRWRGVGGAHLGFPSRDTAVTPARSIDDLPHGASLAAASRVTL